MEQKIEPGGGKWLGVSSAGAIVLAEEIKCLDLLRNAAIAGATTTLGIAPGFALIAGGPLAGAHVG